MKTFAGLLMILCSTFLWNKLLCQSIFEMHIISHGLHDLRNISILDFESDGDLDIISSEWGGNFGLHLFTNNGQYPPSFTYNLVYDNETCPMHLCSGDLNNDGLPDLAEAGGTALNIYINDFPALNVTKINLGEPDNMTRYYSVDIFDFDSDGDNDILSAMHNHNSLIDDGKICWWENVSIDPLVFTEHVLFIGLDIPKKAKGVDFDNDGDIDILGMTSGVQDDVIWWEKTSNEGEYTKHVIDDSFQGANALSVSDIDGDGDNDVAGSNDCWSETAWWEQTTNGFIRHLIRNQYNSESIPCIDIDADGDMDIVGASSGAGVIWWENQGVSPTDFMEHTLYIGPNIQPRIQLCDLDGDNDIDIVATLPDENDEKLVWWENKSDFSKTKELSADLGIKLFPNPASGYLYCHSNVKIKRITLFDSAGKFFSAFEPDNTFFSIDLLNADSDILIVKIESGNNTKYYKILNK